MGIVYFDSWQSHELRVAIMRNGLEVGLKEQRERKNKRKVTQEPIERKLKQKKKKNTRKKIRESLTQMNKKGK